MYDYAIIIVKPTLAYIYIYHVAVSKMNSKSIFVKGNIDFQLLNQSNNFEDACSPEDVQGFLRPARKSLPKVASWHSLSSTEGEFDCHVA